MANSTMIEGLKNAVITKIVNDDAMFSAIDSPDIASFDESDKLINTHLFRFNQNPNVITKEITFLTFQVHISSTFAKGFLVKPTLEIWIYSHHNHMFVDNIPLIDANRNDYISMLLDDMLNGQDRIDNYSLMGKLELKSNTEGSFNEHFLYRRMIFETKDLNDSIC